MTAVTEASTPGPDPVDAAPAARKPKPKRAPQPLTYGRKSSIEIFFLWVFVIAPWVALAAGIWLTWNTSIRLDWKQGLLFIAFYCFTGLGVTVGFHRYLTHGSFKAKRPLKIMLTMAGTMSIEGSPIRWVADHRRHHQFAEEEDDPHSPWRFGESVSGLTRGMIWAHVGWLFNRDNTNARRFTPDLLADPDVRFFHKNAVYVMLSGLILPTVLGYLISGFTWQGALAGYIWAGLVRVALVHHVTWSVNSVCHVFGERPFTTQDKASNVWWLAILSFGESWHNLHHADPTCARHGVDKGQLDSSARLIWIFEKLGWAYNVKWANHDRLDAKRIDTKVAA